MIEFRTFGTLELSGPNSREYLGVLTQPKRVALLAYLATAPPHRFHRRDSLLALFWPELDKDHARAALRQALHGLRRALGADAVASRGDDDVAVDERALWSDVRAFDQVVAADDHAAALELYQGDFLTGFFLSGAREFEQWVERERARLRRAACRAASVLAQRCQTAGDSGRAAEYARRALSLAPDDEGLLRQLITVLDALGDRAGAVAAYDGFTRQLMDEFAAEPSVETQRLITAVRSRELTAAPPDPRASGPKEKAVPRFEVHETPKAPSSVRPRLPVHLIATLAVAVTVGFAGVALALRRTSRSPLEPRRVAVATFANRTGDSALNPLGGMAADWIERGLAQTGLLEIADRLWLDTAHGTGDSAFAQAIAAARRAGTVVWGSFYRQGDSIRFEAQISDARTWTILGSVTPVTAPIGDPTRAIEALRQRVTASLATRFDPKLRDWAEAASQPPTYEAYQEFLAGLEAFQRIDAREALRHYYRAAGMDSTYTLPLVEAAGVHRYLRECAQVDSIGLRFASRRPLPRIERYLLDRFLAECHGDLAAAYRLSRLNVAAL
ncbi:MAG TPA: BTAD domain-containing putative transcriptional regulator, partial [Gemmatimonadales bacterium]